MSIWKLLLAPSMPLLILGLYGARAGANRLAGLFLALAFVLGGTALALYLLGGAS